MRLLIVNFRGANHDLCKAERYTPTKEVMSKFKQILSEGKLLLIHGRYPLDANLLTDQHFVDNVALIMDVDTFIYYSVRLVDNSNMFHIDRPDVNRWIILKQNS